MDKFKDDPNWKQAKREAAEEMAVMRAALEEIASGLSVRRPYDIANEALGRATTE